MKLKQNFFVKCGEWQVGIGLNITDYEALFEGNQMNTTLVVVTILQVPYVMLHTSKNVTGNARFYGFCVDLLEKISKRIGFNYILDLVHDRKVGGFYLLFFSGFSIFSFTLFSFLKFLF
jgi:ionotropic kainate glutamate receptor 2